MNEPLAANYPCRKWRRWAQQPVVDAIRARQSGLGITEMVELGSETVEWWEERNGKAGRELLAAARLLRAPARYVERFGQGAYDIKLNDAFWFVYRMIGKLTQRVYVLQRPS